MDRNELAIILIDQLNRFLYPKLDKTNMTKFSLLGTLNPEVVATEFYNKETCVGSSYVSLMLKEHGIADDAFIRVNKQLSDYGDILISHSYKVLGDGFNGFFVTVTFNLDLTKLNMLKFANELARYE
ncbi:hypothetical protein [Stenotrophomonas phage BUCTxx100]|nr:hypothetical protein [Stenotrophomonas phage BUCTxx100]